LIYKSISSTNQAQSIRKYSKEMPSLWKFINSFCRLGQPWGFRGISNILLELLLLELTRLDILQNPKFTLILYGLR